MFIQQLSALDWHVYNWRISSSYPSWRILPIISPRFNTTILRGLLRINYELCTYNAALYIGSLFFNKTSLHRNILYIIFIIRHLLLTKKGVLPSLRIRILANSAFCNTPSAAFNQSPLTTLNQWASSSTNATTCAGTIVLAGNRKIAVVPLGPPPPPHPSASLDMLYVLMYIFLLLLATHREK